MMDFDALTLAETEAIKAGELEEVFQGTELYIVTYDSVLVRHAPNLEAAIMGIKLEGQSVPVIARRGPWLRLAFRHSRDEQAWMLSQGDSAGLPGVQLLT